MEPRGARRSGDHLVAATSHICDEFARGPARSGGGGEGRPASHVDRVHSIFVHSPTQLLDMTMTQRDPRVPSCSQLASTASYISNRATELGRCVRGHASYTRPLVPRPFYVTWTQNRISLVSRTDAHVQYSESVGHPCEMCGVTCEQHPPSTDHTRVPCEPRQSFPCTVPTPPRGRRHRRMRARRARASLARAAPSAGAARQGPS